MKTSWTILLFMLSFLQMQGQVISVPTVKADTLSQHLNVEVTSLMEISRKPGLQMGFERGTFPESGVINMLNDNGTDSFRVRANHSFIVSLYDEDYQPVQHYTLDVIKRRLEYIVKEVCVASPLSGSEQQVSFSCYCSTDKWFRVKRDEEINETRQLIYTATAP